MNQVSTIAQAVKTLLAGASLSMTPTSVTRVYVPSYDTAITNDLTLTVVGLTQGTDLSDGTRAYSRNDYGVTVAIYKGGVDHTDVSAIDLLSNYREEVIDLLVSNDTVASASLVGISNAPVYDPAMLETKGVFASVITLNYRLLR